MNSDLKVTAHREKVDRSAESSFGDLFYENLSGVCITALANFESRLYVDRQCFLHRLPTLEGVVFGTIGSTAVNVPYLTENYGGVCYNRKRKGSTDLSTLKNLTHS